ncbi:hypothetical protein [Sciscionella sediminilitoris]|uniref:hypothetical protein n=1 Tax=Sciscionella sediminilitoris TaxID=1445613 RepID=UPI0004DF67CA|nr:hypothetical protein [Sciscionella sp. SE31]
MADTHTADPLQRALAAVENAELRATASAERALAPSGMRDIQVDKDNVLQVAEVVQEVLDTEGRKVRELLGEIGILAPGDDLVSKGMAEAWDKRLRTNPDSHVNRIQGYLDSLARLVDRLAEAARSYGFNEEEIAGALNKVGRQ